MLKIRFQRTGKKHDPAYRIVVAEHTAPVQGKFLEKLGSFISRRKAETLAINTERAAYWISVGAQPSDAVARILKANGLKEAEKFIKSRKMKPSKAELEAKQKAEEEKAAKQAAEAEAKAVAEAAASATEASEEKSPEAEKTEETPAEEANGEEK